MAARLRSSRPLLDGFRCTVLSPQAASRRPPALHPSYPRDPGSTCHLWRPRVAFAPLWVLPLLAARLAPACREAPDEGGAPDVPVSVHYRVRGSAEEGQVELAAAPDEDPAFSVAMLEVRSRGVVELFFEGRPLRARANGSVPCTPARPAPSLLSTSAPEDAGQWTAPFDWPVVPRRRGLKSLDRAVDHARLQRREPRLPRHVHPAFRRTRAAQRSGDANQGVVPHQSEPDAAGALHALSAERAAGAFGRGDRPGQIAATADRVSTGTTEPCLRPSRMRASSRSPAWR